MADPENTTPSPSSEEEAGKLSAASPPPLQRRGSGGGAAPKAKSGWINVLVDYGPLLVFFLTYRAYSPDGEDAAGEILAVIRGTGAFIVAFGALTIYFQDERFIQWKPTIIYVGFGALLIGGWTRGKALLKILLEAAFEGLSDEGWLKLSFNWGLFFLFLAALNTTLMYTISFESWLAAKLWLFLPLTFLFTFTQLPMLLRHGLTVEGAEEEKTTPPPTG